MDLDLRGKKALITGASKGIGRACAEVLAEEGCDVALVSRTAADLEAARSAITAKHNVGVRVFPLDLSDSANVDKVAAECTDIDILVNNAGAIPGGDIVAIDEKRWREAWDLKVFGYINMTRRFYAQMRERGHGVIVNVLGLIFFCLSGPALGGIHAYRIAAYAATAKTKAMRPPPRPPATPTSARSRGRATRPPKRPRRRRNLTAADSSSGRCFAAR